MRNRQNRLQALEQRQVATGDTLPGYLCVATEADIEPALAALGPGHGVLKLYVGIDLDDWDRDNETEEQTTGA